MKRRKNIEIIAFESRKTELIEWSYFNKELLLPHEIAAFGFAANILEGTLNKKVNVSENINHKGFRALGNLIEEGKIDALIIFGEANEIFESKDLVLALEKATVNNILVATNKTTADFLLHSSLIDADYKIDVRQKKQGDKPPFLVNDSRTPLAKAS